MYSILNQPIGDLAGVGPALARRLAARGMTCLGDMALHLPRRYVDDRECVPISRLRAGCEARTTGRVLSVQSRRGGPGGQVVIRIGGDGAELLLRFFHSPFLLRDARLRPGREISVRGQPDWRGGVWQMLHPRWIVAEQFEPGWQAEYGVVAGLPGLRVARLVEAALQRLPANLASPLDDLLPHLPGFVPSLRLIHHPGDAGPDAVSAQQARERLRLEELLTYLYLMNQKRVQAQVDTQPLSRTELCEQLRRSFPHALTEAQSHAWSEIQADLASGRRMHRLVQGDVGAGKTWLAALAMAAAIDNGGQAALMAPTEVLASQHAAHLNELLQPLGQQVALLHGGMRPAARRQTLAGLADGTIAAVVGTHALVSGDVGFHRLLLAVVDEQHRFGVRQRWALAERGDRVHLLAMTATPIPRTLALALYGDMDLSIMRGMPPGRVPVQTSVVSPQAWEKLAAGMARILGQGGSIYWIVPRIDEDEDGASVDQRGAALATAFPQAGVRCLHGRMSGADKRAILQAFTEGECRILVATTVVEVGVNVPRARLIVIEQADRYGLAQLHQLRGRVGRSHEQGYCVLMPGPDAGHAARQRLNRLTGIHDGMMLAEMDMQLRGAGDAIGVRQSGEADFRLLDIVRDASLIREWHGRLPDFRPGDDMLRFWRPQAFEAD